MDRGWSWVVCAAVFFSHLLVIGFCYSIGVYYVEFLTVFGQSKGTTALISSLNFGALSFIGPVASWIIHRHGHRVTMFVGGIIAAAGLFICAFATSIYVVFISFGIISGLGSGLVFIASITVIGVYFEKYRPIAFGLSGAGIGVGNICFAWVNETLIEVYGWRGALIITSGLLLNVCVFAMLIMRREKLALGNSNTCTYDSKCENVANLKPDTLKNLTTQVISNINFIWLLVATWGTYFGISIFFTHTMAFVESRHLSSSLGSLMISTFGLTSLVGRVILSMFSQHPKVNTLLLYITATLLFGVAMAALPVFTAPTGMVVCSGFVGFFYSSAGPVNAEVCFIITKPKLNSIAYGFVSIAAGLGWILGAPVAGILYDITLHYPISFYVAGVVSGLGGLVMIPTLIGPKFKRLEEKGSHLEETGNLPKCVQPGTSLLHLHSSG